MKVEIIKVVAADVTLKELQKENAIPFTLAWEIDDMLEIFSKHVERFNKERQKLVTELGEPDKENPEMYHIKTESIKNYNEKIEEIASFEVELEGLKKLKKEDLKSLVIPGSITIADIKEFIDESK